MGSKTKKHILKAAKDSVNQKYADLIEAAHLKLEGLLYDPRHVDEAGNFTCSQDDGCEICAEIKRIRESIAKIQDDWADWAARAKKNKKKVGKRVEWTNQREQAPMRTVDNTALEEFKRARKESAKPQVGAAWLFEGALVTKRGKTEVMIVTRMRGSSAECLKDGTTQWHRSVSLRPADWLFED